MELHLLVLGERKKYISGMAARRGHGFHARPPMMTAGLEVL